RGDDPAGLLAARRSGPAGRSRGHPPARRARAAAALAADRARSAARPREDQEGVPPAADGGVAPQTAGHKGTPTPRSTGTRRGMRQISAPMPRLKKAQEWVLHNLLEKVAVHDAAHGFRRGRSIVSNAAPHIGADVVVNMDLQDFFPTVTYRRIRGVFRKLGYS